MWQLRPGTRKMSQESTGPLVGDKLQLNNTGKEKLAVHSLTASSLRGHCNHLKYTSWLPWAHTESGRQASPPSTLLDDGPLEPNYI